MILYRKKKMRQNEYFEKINELYIRCIFSSLQTRSNALGLKMEETKS